MKKLVAAALFLCAAAVSAQSWTALPNAWVRIDGGAIVPAGGGGVEPYSGTPVLGDLICFDGANWISLVAGTTGDFLGANTGACPTYQALPAAGGAVSLQGAYPGTPDAGHANVTGTIGSTHNNIHATLGNFGLSLENNQAALVGQTQEYTPGIRLLGAAWDTDGAVSNTNAWQIVGRPLDGNTTAIDLSFYRSLAGGAYALKMNLDSAGKLSLGEATATNGELRLYGATSGSITLTPTSGALGTVTLTLPAVSGTVLQSGTDVTLAQIVPASGASKLLGRGSSGGGGDFQEITIGTELSMSGTTLSYSRDPVLNINIFDDFLCGRSSGATMVFSCLGIEALNTSGTAGGATTPDVNSPGVAFIGKSTAATGVSFWGSQSSTLMIIADTQRFRTRVQLPDLSTTADTYTAYFGMFSSSTTSTAAPTAGAWFWYTNTDANGTPKWQITVDNTTSGPTTADCTNAGNVAADTWYSMDIRYESGVGYHFSVGGTECTNSPINSPLPSATDYIRPFAFKIVGSTYTAIADQLWIDYVWYTQTVTR